MGQVHSASLLDFRIMSIFTGKGNNLDYLFGKSHCNGNNINDTSIWPEAYPPGTNLLNDFAMWIKTKEAFTKIEKQLRFTIIFQLK